MNNDENNIVTTFQPLLRNEIRWFEEAGDGAGGWDIEKITDRIGDTDCHVVNDDNVMELNLVDIAGKSPDVTGAAAATAKKEKRDGAEGYGSELPPSSGGP